MFTQVFAVNTSLGIKSFAELAALVKSKPKTFNYMAPSLSKVAFMEEFNKKNGTDIVRVPFKGGGDAVNSMLNGTGADRDLRHRQPGVVHSRRQDHGAGHRRRHPLAACPQHPDLQGGRLHRAYRARLSSAFSRRPARRSRSSTS